MSDLLRTLAFAFRRKGADSIPGSDLRLLLAYDLRWFAPEDAKRVVARGLELGLLQEAGEGVVRAAFDAGAVTIPVNFRPSTLVLDEEPPADVPAARAVPVSAPVPAPAPSPRPAHAQAAEAERARRGNLLSVEAAALVVARRAGEDVRDRLADAEAHVFKG